MIPAFEGASVVVAVVIALVLGVVVRPRSLTLSTAPIVLAFRLRFILPFDKTSIEPITLYFPGLKTSPLTVIKKIKTEQTMYTKSIPKSSFFFLRGDIQ